MKRLDRYVLREILGPLGLGMLVYTFIMLLNFLFRSAEMIIRYGLPLSTVGELLLLTLPNIVVLTIPMSLLFAILIAVGRLASDSELVALRAGGVSLLTLYRPILLISGFLTAINAVLMIWVLPWGNHELQLKRLDIYTQGITQEVKPRVFDEQWEGVITYVFDIPPDAGGRWKGVFYTDAVPSTQQNKVTIAEWGELKLADGGERVVLALWNASVHEVDLTRPEQYTISHHKTLEYTVSDSFISDQRANISASKSIRELTWDELLATAKDPTQTSEIRRLANVEKHKKLAIPLASFVFGLVALPLGFNNRRGGKASGFALSILVILAYWLLLDYGEKSARVGEMSPLIAMWMGNVAFALLGFFLLLRRNADKSLLLTRFDRWIRQDLWHGITVLASRRKQRQERKRALKETARALQARERGEGEPISPRVVFRFARPRLRFPNLMDRYVVRTFTSVLLLVSASLVILFIVGDLTGKAGDILEHEITRSTVVDYYKYLSIQIVYDLSPIFILVSTLVTFSLLSRTNEIVAAKALGLSLYRLALPVLAISLLVAGISVYLQSEVLPASSRRVQQLDDQIRGRETVRSYRRADRQWLFGQGRYIYNYLRFEPADQSLQRLQIFEFDDSSNLVGRLVTNRARYEQSGDEGDWIFDDGWVRRFSGTLTTEFESFDEPRLVAYPETPEYFNSVIRPPDQMRYGELKEYIAELEASGQEVPELKVQLHRKLAFPAMSLVMSLIALPFAFRMGRQGALYGVGLSIVLGMVFIAIFAFFSTLGTVGALPAVLAAWSPSIVFTMLSVYLFLGVRT